MKCKKILSAVLACSLLASMSVSAFAAATDLTQSSEITGTTQVPTINIYHPEFKSRPNRAHPVFRAFIAAALRFDEGFGKSKEAERGESR